jgi:hypothetical protein
MAVSQLPQFAAPCKTHGLSAIRSLNVAILVGAVIRYVSEE